MLFQVSATDPVTYAGVTACFLVVALLVAIPAKFGYNFLLQSIKAMIVRMDNFAAELSSGFHRHYVDYSRRDCERSHLRWRSGGTR